MSLNPEFIKKSIEMLVKQQLTENVKISYTPSANNYKISVWKDGISAGAVARKNGWENLIIAFKNYCSDLKKAVNQMDEKAHITLILLNDLNQAQTLLTITDGTVLYNFRDKKASSQEV